MSPPEVTDNFDVGPRGLCMVSDKGEIWCAGASRARGASWARR